MIKLEDEWEYLIKKSEGYSEKKLLVVGKEVDPDQYRRLLLRKKKGCQF